MAHAAGKQDLDALPLQELDRRHAATLCVAGVFENRNLGDFSIPDSDECERAAVTEVLGDGGIEASGIIRRDRNQHGNLLVRVAMVLRAPIAVEWQF